MSYNPDIHQRHSIRLPDYDYSSAGAYFVTICTFERKCLLGDILDWKMCVNDAGLCVKTIWDSLPKRYPVVEVDSFVVMPNHIHGIIMITGCEHPVKVGAIHESPRFPPPQRERAIRESPLQNRRNMLLPKIVGYLKMNTAKRINQLHNNPGVPVWQRSYYERVLRNDRELQTARQYIHDNPMQWTKDENHPTHA